MALLRAETFRVYLGGKAAQDSQWRWVMVPGIGYSFGAFGDV
jgi:hypothetical protein